MFRNYLKTAIGHLMRHRFVAAIEIGSLAFGFALCFLIALFVYDEWSYDHDPPQADHIVRLICEYQYSGKVDRSPQCLKDIGPRLKASFPEVLESARVVKPGSQQVLQYQDRVFTNVNVFFADPEIFKIFGWRILNYISPEAWKTPFSMIITQSTARRIFGDESPVGKILRTQDNVTYTVIGIMEDVPIRSHFRPDAIVTWAGEGSKWHTHTAYTYLLLGKDTPRNLFENHLAIFARTYTYSGRFMKDSLIARGLKHLTYQPLKKIHLFSSFKDDIAPQGDFRLVFSLTAFAILVLIVAGINFTNFKMAHSIPRVREIGIRQSLGATRKQIAGQFLMEYLLVGYIGMFLALVIFEWTYSLLQEIMNRPLKFGHQDLPFILVVIIAIPLLTGVFAGLYPALYLASLNPNRTLRGELPGLIRLTRIRKFLVAVQFFITAGFIVITLNLHQQVKFITHKDMGFDPDRVLLIPLIQIAGYQARNRAEPFKQALQALPQIEQVSLATGLPGWITNVPGPIEIRRMDSPGQKPVTMEAMISDEQFIETLRLKLIAGRNFETPADPDLFTGGKFHACQKDRPCPEEITSVAILNEMAIRALGYTDPRDAIGRKIRMSNANASLTIIGVVRNFHSRSLYHPIQPTILLYSPTLCQLSPNVILRFKTDRPADTRAQVESVWRQFFPDAPVVFFELKYLIESEYQPVIRLLKALNGITTLILAIACFGMLGLTSVVIEQRKREFCIRRVVGAEGKDILFIIWRDFLKIAGIATVLSWPFAYDFTTRLLSDFSYQTGLNPNAYVMSLFLTCGLTLMMTAFYGFRIIRMNPAPVLRYE